MPPADNSRESFVERQLGEVVGTLKMTVAGLESLKESVERLAERAAFKGDLEAVRLDIDRRIETLSATMESRKSEIGKLGEKIDTLQKWMWTCGGAFAVLLTILQFIRPAIRISLGN